MATATSNTFDITIAAAEADWTYRTSLPGVIWAHDFSEDREVTDFMWSNGFGGGYTGTYKDDLFRQTGDGITGGGCLEHLYPSGRTSSIYWWRGFQPWYQSGYSAPTVLNVDGSVATEWGNGVPYTGSSNPGIETSRKHGNISHPAHDNASYETLSRDSYLIASLKYDPRWLTPGFSGSPQGKIMYHTRTENSLRSQETILGKGSPETNPAFLLQTATDGAGGNLNYQGDPAWGSGQGSVKTGTTENLQTQQGSEVWPTVVEMPINEWFDVQIHHRAGRESDDTTPVADRFFETVRRMWIKRQSDDNWIKVWDYWQYATDYQDSEAPIRGWNCMITDFANSWTGGTEHWMRWDQVGLSKTFWPARGKTLAPEWVEDAITAGWAVGDWIAISGSNPTQSGVGETYENILTPTNTMVDVAQVSESVLNATVIQAYDGGILAHDIGNYGTYILGPAGAHTSGSTGDMYAFDIESRTWSELVPPNTSGHDATSRSFGEFIDGAPKSNHTSSWRSYDSYNGRWIIPKGWEVRSGSDGSTSFNVPYGHALNLRDAINGYNASQWDRLPSVVDNTTVEAGTDGLEVGWNTYGASVFDERRKWLWCFGGYDSRTNNPMAIFDCINEEWISVTAEIPMPNGYDWAYDTRRDVMLSSGSQTPVVRMLIDAKDPEKRYSGTRGWAITETGTPPGLTESQSIEFSEAIDGFVHMDAYSNGFATYKGVYVSGGDSLTAGVATDYTLNWSLINDGSSLPQDDVNGPRNKFRVIDWGHHSVGFIIAAAGNPVYALRIN